MSNNDPWDNSGLIGSATASAALVHLAPRSSGVQSQIFLPVVDYDLAATLDSGQAFRWRKQGDIWEGVIRSHFVLLKQTPHGIHAGTTGTDVAAITKTFPPDDPMNAAVASCQGLRLLRQDPWECLASFILSSTKQIVQIRQIISLLCTRFGEPITVPSGWPQEFAFPSPVKIAAATEADLRACMMGFRSRGLLAAARRIEGGQFDLEKLGVLSYAEARQKLMTLHGVGAKIADCVLLFAYGFDSAFPLDVWVKRALQELYFPRRRASEKKLQQFAATHFGPHAGYAQQYLFHYIRTKLRNYRANKLG